MRFNALPRDALINIFSRLSIQDVITFSSSSKNLANIASVYLSITSVHLNPIAKAQILSNQSSVTAFIKDIAISGQLDHDQLYRIGKACPNLQRVSLNIPGGLDAFELHSFLAIIGSSLRHFAVEFCGGLSSDIALQSLTHNCHQLQSVTLRFASRVTATELTQLVQKFGQTLQVLELDSCAGVDNDVLRAIAKYCVQLHTLCVGGSEDVGDEGVEAIAYSQCANTLVKLDIRSCMRITDDGVFAIATCCKQLLYVNLWRVCVTSYSVRAIAEGQGEWLRTLVIGDSIGIDDIAIISISNNCDSLVNLEMCGLTGITDLGVMALFNAKRTGLLRLESLTVDRCENVSCRSILAAVGLWDKRWHGDDMDLPQDDFLSEEQYLRIQWIGQVLREAEQSKQTISGSIEALMENHIDREYEKASSIEDIEDEELWDTESSDSEISNSSISSHPSRSEESDIFSNDCDSFISALHTSYLKKLSMRGTQISKEMWKYIRTRKKDLEMYVDVIDSSNDIRVDYDRLVQSPSYRRCTSAFCRNCLLKRSSNIHYRDRIQYY